MQAIQGEYKLTIKPAPEFKLVDKLAFDMFFNGEIKPYETRASHGELYFASEEDAELVAERAKLEMGIQ